MNAAVTLGVKKVNGKPVFTIVTDPNTPHRIQRKQFRVLRRKLHGEFDEVQLWTSTGGRVKKQRTTAVNLPVTSSVPAPVVQPAETTDPLAETTVSDNSAEGSTPSPVPDKKGAALAKARAAAAAKKASKAQDLLS